MTKSHASRTIATILCGDCVIAIDLERALLQQNAKFIIWDESFAALEPETFQKSVECVWGSSVAGWVIAHP